MANLRLRAERLNRGKTYVALAADLDLPEHVLRHAEGRDGRPNPERMLKIADYFGVKVTDIWPVEAQNGSGKP